MSADNEICVQKRGDKWHVWHNLYPEDDDPEPGGADHKIFNSEDEADKYSHELHEELWVVEYGIQWLPDKCTG